MDLRILKEKKTEKLDDQKSKLTKEYSMEELIQSFGERFEKGEWLSGGEYLHIAQVGDRINIIGKNTAGSIVGDTFVDIENIVDVIRYNPTTDVFSIVSKDTEFIITVDVFICKANTNGGKR